MGGINSPCARGKWNYRNESQSAGRRGTREEEKEIIGKKEKKTDISASCLMNFGRDEGAFGHFGAKLARSPFSPNPLLEPLFLMKTLFTVPGKARHRVAASSPPVEVGSEIAGFLDSQPFSVLASSAFQRRFQNSGVGTRTRWIPSSTSRVVFPTACQEPVDKRQRQMLGGD